MTFLRCLLDGEIVKLNLTWLKWQTIRNIALILCSPHSNHYGSRIFSFIMTINFLRLLSMPVLISAMASRKGPSKVAPFVKNALAKQDKYRPEQYRCFIEYPFINITISASRSDPWENYIEGATFKEHELFKLKFEPAYGGFDIRHREYIDGYKGVSFDEDFEGRCDERWYGHEISGKIASKDPFDTLFREIRPMLVDGVTDSKCREVAKYIEDHPRGKYKNNEETVWVREYLSETPVLYPF